MSFIDDYRRLVLPILAEKARYHGRLAMFLDLDFHDAVEEVWAIAHQRGAGYLPQDYYLHLRDWVMSRVCEGMDEADRAIDRVHNGG